MSHDNFFYYVMWHDVMPQDPLYIFKTQLKNYYYVGTWHFTMGYNIVANNGDQLQTLYK